MYGSFTHRYGKHFGLVQFHGCHFLSCFDFPDMFRKQYDNYSIRWQSWLGCSVEMVFRCCIHYLDRKFLFFKC